MKLDIRNNEILDFVILAILSANIKNGTPIALEDTSELMVNILHETSCHFDLEPCLVDDEDSLSYFFGGDGFHMIRDAESGHVVKGYSN
ncbi:hypothetical protein L9G16_01060 [Shewanella sp. A25]|nr:hypothetical protein [Shewanella shenzhenensis]